MTENTATPARAHVPVMLNEVLAALAPQDGELFVDGTFGAGGYTHALLEACECRVIAIDRDPQAFVLGAGLLEVYAGRLTYAAGRFSQMEDLMAQHDILSVDGVVLDVGVSSMQLDMAERGFSFMREGPLDMRMDQGRNAETPTAADIVNREDEAGIAKILHILGEERAARRIARAIIEAREVAPFETTLQLANLVEQVIGRKHGRQKIHPATKTFQALRMFVNRELEELSQALVAAERLLKPSGRLAVVCFHSLEDRIVKSFLNERAGKRPRPSRHLPDLPDTDPEPSFKLPPGGARKASREETEANPRARSARLRSAQRTMASAFPISAAPLPVPVFE